MIKRFASTVPSKELVASVTFLSHTNQPLDHFVSFARQAAQAFTLQPSKTQFPVANTPLTSFYPKESRELVRNERVTNDLSKVSYEVDRYTVNRSKFIYAKHQDTFEIRTYKRQLDIFNGNDETVKRWMHYLSMNLPFGVGFEYTLYEKEPLLL